MEVDHEHPLKWIIFEMDNFAKLEWHHLNPLRTSLASQESDVVFFQRRLCGFLAIRLSEYISR